MRRFAACRAATALLSLQRAPVTTGPTARASTGCDDLRFVFLFSSSKHLPLCIFSSLCISASPLYISLCLSLSLYRSSLVLFHLTFNLFIYLPLYQSSCLYISFFLSLSLYLSSLCLFHLSNLFIYLLPLYPSSCL